jgi:hypothetical protein
MKGIAKDVLKITPVAEFVDPLQQQVHAEHHPPSNLTMQVLA